MGRPLTPEDDQVPGRDAVVVLSQPGCQRFFPGQTTIVGKTLRVSRTRLYGDRRRGRRILGYIAGRSRCMVSAGNG